MRVIDLFSEIRDGLDMNGEIISIDVIQSNNKPVSLNIKATCPNYPEVSCGYYQISLSDLNECQQLVCSENINDDLKNFAKYEYSKDKNINSERE